MPEPDSRSSLKSPRPVAAAQELAVDIVREGGDWSGLDPIEPLIEAVARELAATRDLDFGIAEASIALATDAQVRDLNRSYRGKDKPTNVLSFPSAMPVVANEPTYLGDVILAAETVRAEAAELGIPLAHHFQHLCLHGLMHLLGFDHIQASDAREMEKLETAILARLGIPDPYTGDIDDTDDGDA
jgi:probable rRNA maturation factor